MASVRLLQCPELLKEICSYLELPASVNNEGSTSSENRHERQARRSTLAAAALSCRAFTEHAQAMLWRSLDSVQPLLCLLSNSRLQVSNDPVTILYADITPESWRRFRSHARHVKVLYEHDWSAVQPSTWAFVARWCGPEPLLPNLEELAGSGLPINVRSPTTMMFISPNLRSLSLVLTMDDHNGHIHVKKLQGDPTTTYILLQQIVSIAPGLRSLSIDNRLSVPTACYYPIEFLRKIKTLHARECVFGFSQLRSLGRRPLRSLAATVDMTNLPPPPEDPDDEDEEYDPFDYCFRTLKHLTVRGAPGHIDLFLFHSTTCELRTLAVEFLSGAGQEVITRCIEHIADDALLADPVLRSLTIKYPYESHYDDEHKSGNAGAHTLRDATLPAVIAPALRIPFLRRVTLDFHITPALTDAGLLQMVDAWPRLTALHITPPRERYESRVKLSPLILVALAQRCPRLTELTLPQIPLDSVPAEKDMPLVGQRALRRLRIAFHDRGREHVLYKAALFLDRLFPCLALDPQFEEVVVDPPGHGFFRWENDAREEEQTWRRIEEFLYVMQLGKRHREELRNGSGNAAH